VELRRLGDSGLQVSAVGLGTNNFAGRLHDEAARAVLNEALELGVTFIDTADVYGRGSDEGTGASESQLGRLIAGRRHRFVVATKVGLPMSESPTERGASRRWIVTEIENSLRRLRTDYMDLYQVHTPDPETPIEETLRALDDLVVGRQGQIRGPQQLRRMADRRRRLDGSQRASDPADLSPDALQPAEPRDLRRSDPGLRGPRDRHHPLLPARIGVPHRQVPQRRQWHRRQRHRWRQIAESPRAAEVMSAANFARIESFEAFAAERSHSLLDLAFGWLLSQPIVGPVIASASTPDQVRANVAAAEWRLSQADMASFAEL
jgi:aryl-alcohol dehydrogenase-like predicted oxidoreductase